MIVHYVHIFVTLIL